MSRLLSVVLVVALLSANGQVTIPVERPTSKERVNPVEVPVVVRDESGRAVANLRQDDFQLFDRGKPQAIRRFAAASLAARSVEPSSPAKPERFVAYLFDDLCLGNLQLQQARDAAIRQFSNSIGPADRAAVFTTSGQIMADFTADRAKLLETLHNIRMRHDDMSQGEVSLHAVRQTVERISTVPGQRNVILASPGFLTREIKLPFRAVVVVGHDLKQEVSDVIDRAIRSGVVINCLDGRGLFTNPIGPFSEFISDDQRSRSEVLADLAHGTGGTFFENNNDFDRGFRDAAGRPEFSYILGFSPQSLKYDGGYHTLKVTLKNPRHLEVQARRGYNAPKQ